MANTFTVFYALLVLSSSISSSPYLIRLDAFLFLEHSPYLNISVPFLMIVLNSSDNLSVLLRADDLTSPSLSFY